MSRAASLRQAFIDWKAGRQLKVPRTCSSAPVGEHLSCTYHSDFNVFVINNQSGWNMTLAVDEAQKLKDFLVSMLEDR